MSTLEEDVSNDVSKKLQGLSSPRDLCSPRRSASDAKGISHVIIDRAQTIIPESPYTHQTGFSVIRMQLPFSFVLAALKLPQAYFTYTMRGVILDLSKVPAKVKDLKQLEKIQYIAEIPRIESKSIYVCETAKETANTALIATRLLSPADDSLCVEYKCVIDVRQVIEDNVEYVDYAMNMLYVAKSDPEFVRKTFQDIIDRSLHRTDRSFTDLHNANVRVAIASQAMDNLEVTGAKVVAAGREKFIGTSAEIMEILNERLKDIAGLKQEADGTCYRQFHIPYLPDLIGKYKFTVNVSKNNGKKEKGSTSASEVPDSKTMVTTSDQTSQSHMTNIPDNAVYLANIDSRNMSLDMLLTIAVADLPDQTKCQVMVLYIVHINKVVNAIARNKTLEVAKRGSADVVGSVYGRLELALQVKNKTTRSFIENPGLVDSKILNDDLRTVFEQTPPNILARVQQHRK